MRVTGLGSLRTFHFTDRRVRSPVNLADQNARMKELFFFNMLERGYYLARRGIECG